MHTITRIKRFAIIAAGTATLAAGIVPGAASATPVSSSWQVYTVAPPNASLNTRMACANAQNLVSHGQGQLESGNAAAASAGMANVANGLVEGQQSGCQIMS